MASHRTCFALALAVAVGTPGVVFAQTDTSQPWTANWEVVNNTTTPDVRTSVPTSQLEDGVLPVSCGGNKFFPIGPNTTYDKRCSVAADASAKLRYMVYIGNSQFHDQTVAWDCQQTQTLTATFSGSGESITVQTACSGGDSSDDDSGSGSGGSGSGDGGSDDSGSGSGGGGGSGSGGGGGSGSGGGGGGGGGS